MFGDKVEKVTCSSCGEKYILRWHGDKPKIKENGKGAHSADCPYCSNRTMVNTGGTNSFTVYPMSIYTNYISTLLKGTIPFALVVIAGAILVVIQFACENRTFEILGSIGLELGAAALIILFVDRAIEYRSLKTEDKVKQMASLRIKSSRFIPLFIKSRTPNKIEVYDESEMYAFLGNQTDWFSPVVSLNDINSTSKSIADTIIGWANNAPHEIDQIAKLAPAYPELLAEMIKIKDYIMRSRGIFYLLFDTLKNAQSESDKAGTRGQIIEILKRLNDELAQFSLSFKAREGLY